jgi:hypothetical protein
VLKKNDSGVAFDSIVVSILSISVGTGSDVDDRCESVEPSGFMVSFPNKSRQLFMHFLLNDLCWN